MTFFGNVIYVGAMAVGTLSFNVSDVMAHIVCGGISGACWHVQEKYDYPASAGVIIHPSDWSWGSDANYRLREHDGRAYWHGDDWVPF